MKDIPNYKPRKNGSHALGDPAAPGNILEAANEVEQARQDRLCPIVINFDPIDQTVELKFDPELYKTWEFVLGIIAMAKGKAQQMGAMARAITMQQQAMAQHQQAMQAQAIAQQIELGKR